MLVNATGVYGHASTQEKEATAKRLLNQVAQDEDAAAVRLAE